MNLLTLYITLGIVAAVVAPMFAYSYSLKSKKKKKLQQFLSMGEKHQMMIEEYDFSLYASIGIDKKAGKLIYVHGKSVDAPELVIDLKNYKHCEAANVSRSVGSQKDLTTIIDRVELVLKPKEQTEKEVKLEFFNSEHDSHITDENETVAKWAGVVNQWIKKN